MELVYFCCWIAFSATISINDTTRMWGEECTIHSQEPSVLVNQEYEYI